MPCHASPSLWSPALRQLYTEALCQKWCLATKPKTRQHCPCHCSRYMNPSPDLVLLWQGGSAQQEPQSWTVPSLIREGEGQGWKGRRLKTNVPWGGGYEKKNKKQALKYRVGGAVSVSISLLQPHGGGHSTPPLEEGQKEERLGASCYCQPAACSRVRETPGRRESSSSGAKAYSHSSCKCSPGGSLHWTIPATGPRVKQRRWWCSLQWAKTTLAQWYLSWSA